VTVTVLAGTAWVTVDEGCVVVTVTVPGRVTVSGWVGGAWDVSVGVVVVVGVVAVAIVRVRAVGAVRMDVRVPTAALLPPPPHEESARPPNAIRKDPRRRELDRTRSLPRSPCPDVHPWPSSHEAPDT
jgi:hypothetical protein